MRDGHLGPGGDQALAAHRGHSCAGYDAVPDAAAPARALRRDEHRRALWRLFVASFCAMQVMMFTTPSYVAGAGELAPARLELAAATSGTYMLEWLQDQHASYVGRVRDTTRFGQLVLAAFPHFRR